MRRTEFIRKLNRLFEMPVLTKAFIRIPYAMMDYLEGKAKWLPK
jgi:hypothetical protein